MSGDAAALRDAFRSFFTRESPPERVRAAETADPPGFDAALWAQAATLGLPGLALDGASLADLAVIAEEYGRAVAPIPVVETTVAARLLDRLGVAGSVADAALVTLALRPAHRGVVSLVPAGAVADAVIARHGDRLVLAAGERGPSAAPTLGAAPLASWTIAESTPALAAGAAAGAAFDRALDEWRVLTAAALVGLARRAVELGVDYASARHQFGVPIGSFQAIQHRLADVATLVAAAGLLVDDAVGSEPVTPAAASRAYLAAGRAARDAAGASLHVHGGYGFMLEYDVQLYFRRAAAWPLVLGDPASERAHLADLLAAGGWAPPEPPPSPLRTEVRSVVADACTPAVLERVEASGTVHDWSLHRRLADAGLLAAGWPAEWGGRDDPAAEGVLWEELIRVGAPTDGWGTSDLVARTLARVGRDDQRRDVVPRVLAGEILICLGYSEPDSGSDVAAATTRAERDGDDWVINGQKMFTTLAHEAAYVFLLTRTNPDVPKHRGLTMFLVPMDSPGIEITPVWTLSGERTNITYYTDVRVPDTARVGDTDGGWDVMRVALDLRAQPDHGRRARPGPAPLRHLGPDAARGARSAQRPGPARRPVGRPRSRPGPRRPDGGARPRAGSCRSSRDRWRSCSRPRRSGGAAPRCSTRSAPTGSSRPARRARPRHGELEAMYRHAQVTTIRAGTSEIQRGIIAERGLGLPRAGR